MARVSHLDQGDIWVVQANFTVNGTPTDPTQVTFKYRNPGGTVTTVGPVSGGTGGSGITRQSAGVYTYSVTLDDAGRWYARFEGTGTATAAEDYEAVVDPSVFYESAQLGTQALVTLAEAKDWLNQQRIDTSEDLELARVINDVSDRMSEAADREFIANGTNPQTRTFELGDSRTLKVGDLTSFTAVRIISSVDWTTVLNTPSLAQVASLPFNRKPWEPITRLQFASTVAGLSIGARIEVDGNWGFPAVPGTVRQAVLDTIAWIIDRDVEHYRTDLGAVQTGVPVIVATQNQRILELPPSALAVAIGFRPVLLA